MLFKTEIIDDILIVLPPRMDLDANDADEFKRDIAPVIAGHQKVALNLTSIGFMDSAGLGAMLSAYRKVQAEGGQFRIFGLNPEVKELFELVRMHRLFAIYQDKDSTIRSFT